MKVFSGKYETTHSEHEYLQFLAVLTMFDPSYFHIFCPIKEPANQRTTLISVVVEEINLEYIYSGHDTVKIPLMLALNTN
jgi:hypothetical protein